MAKPLKTQIMEAIIARLKPLKNEGDFATIERVNDLLASSKTLPSLQVTDGEENMTGKDQMGRTFQFLLTFKISLRDYSDPHAKKDELVARLQEVFESSLSIDDEDSNELACIIEGGAEQPFVIKQAQPQVGTMVDYIIEYRRRLGVSRSTY